EAGDGSEGGEALDDRSLADEHELRLREIRLHIDLQRATAVARHAVFDHAFRPAGRTRAFPVEPDETWATVAERAEGFADDHGLGAGAADPSPQAAVLTDQDLRAGLRRGRRLAADDRGQRKRLAALLQIGRER